MSGVSLRGDPLLLHESLKPEVETVKSIDLDTALTSSRRVSKDFHLEPIGNRFPNSAAMSSMDRALFPITSSGITYSPTVVDGDCVVEDNGDGIKDDDVEEEEDNDRDDE